MSRAYRCGAHDRAAARRSIGPFLYQKVRAHDKRSASLSRSLGFVCPVLLLGYGASFLLCVPYFMFFHF